MRNLQVFQCLATFPHITLRFISTYSMTCFSLISQGSRQVAILALHVIDRKGLAVGFSTSFQDPAASYNHWEKIVC